jgi:aspartate aminotransferase
MARSIASSVTLSSRSTQAPASPIRKLVPFAEEAEKKGINIYRLNIGQPDIETPPEMLDAVRKMDQRVISYSPSNGIPSCRKAFMEYYSRLGFELSDDELIVTTAGSEALLFALACATDPGDEFPVPEPLYANYLGFSSLLGIRAIPITCLAETGYHLPEADSIEKLITPRTKAVLFANPGNPTGVVYTRDEISNLIEISKRHGLFMIADEVYREFTYDGVEATSILSFQEIGGQAAVADSISKRYSACGARVGCLVSKNKDFIASALKFAQARLSPPTMGQLLASAATRLEKDYFEKTRSEYKQRRDLVCEVLTSIPDVVCLKPEGSFYIMAKLPIADSDDFAKWLLQSYNLRGETLMIAPGTGFYATPGAGKSEIRIAYVLNIEDLKKALVVLREGLKEYRNIKG